MKLPSSLSPWAQQLKIFPDEISFVIGAMAKKISPFITPLYSGEEASDREPNGYDGVARRGIYERLLLSELALADELSEEFVRRAVMGEHLFLNLARVAPSAKRMSVALFSSGADQLGAPRVAHIAVLIILARRAAAANAIFEWGILQDNKLKTFSELNESNIRHLINSRTSGMPTRENISRWCDKYQDLDTPANFWLIGGSQLQEFDEIRDYSLIAVEEVLIPDSRQLQISVRSSSGILKETILDLPEESAATRLLRNPFEVYKLPEKVNLKSRLNSFFFDDNGGKLFARGIDEKTVLYLPVPNSPNTAGGNPRQYRLQNQNDLLLAAGRLGKSIATVALTEKGHLNLDYSKRGNFRLPPGNYKIEGDFILPNNSQSLLPIYNLHFPDSQTYPAALTDAKNNLFLLTKADNIGEGLAGLAEIIAADVAACVRTERRFIFVGRETDSKNFQVISYGQKTEKRELDYDEDGQAFFGRGGIAHPLFGLLAYGNKDNHFVILSNNIEKRIEVNPASQIVGLFYDPSFSAEVGLVELEENRRTLTFNVGRKYNKQIFISGEEIEKIIFSQRSPLCAYQTVSGQIIVYSLTHSVPIESFGG